MVLRSIDEIHIPLRAVNSYRTQSASLSVSIHTLNDQHLVVIVVKAVVASPFTLPGTVVSLVDSCCTDYFFQVSITHLLTNKFDIGTDNIWEPNLSL